MYHHDNRDYNVAVSDAAKKGRVKMEEIVQQSLSSAERVIDQVRSRTVLDAVAPARALTVVPGGDGFSLKYGDNEHLLHDHALGQVLESAGMDRRFANNVMGRGDWGKDLVAHNLNTIFGHAKSRHLVRSADDRVMGFLSDRFRRLDSRPLLDAFVGAIQSLGMVPYNGHALDTKVRLRAILPKVFEPIPNEVMLFGLEWGNSDFGNGGHCVNLFMLRIWCTNLAIGESCLRQVHLGKRLEDDISYSKRTYELDTQTNVSALKDVVNHSIAAPQVNGYLEMIKDASEDEIKGKDGIVGILKKHLDKGDIDRVVAAFESPDVQNLPPGNSVYRLSNAVSWIAQAKGVSAEKRLELEEVAGKLLPIKARKAVEV
jgi:hypothetical protein